MKNTTSSSDETRKQVYRCTWKQCPHHHKPVYRALDWFGPKIRCAICCSFLKFAGIVETKS